MGEKEFSFWRFWNAKLLLYLDGLKKVTFKGKRVEICMYNTIYMHIDIKVIFDPNTLSYMESETKKE